MLRAQSTDSPWPFSRVEPSPFSAYELLPFYLGIIYKSLNEYHYSFRSSEIWSLYYSVTEAREERLWVTE